MGSIGITQIPTVDLSPFAAGGDLTSRQRAARDLASKLQINGSVGITGHGVPEHIIQQALAYAKQLFSLPLEDKLKAPHPKAMIPHRGYSTLYTERGAAVGGIDKDNPAMDYKETFEIGSEANEVQTNIWLPEDVFPGFRETGQQLFWQLNKAYETVLDALIMSLELTEDEAAYVKALHSCHENQYRLAHYPAITKEMLDSGPISRVGAHTDWGSFTVGWQDENGGLEFYDRGSEKFLPCTPKEGTLYLNMADMGERISNGRYPSGIHRVNASKVSPSRISLILFIVNKWDSIIEPPKSLVAADGVQRFEPTSCVAYAEAKNRAYRKSDHENEHSIKHEDERDISHENEYGLSYA